MTTILASTSIRGQVPTLYLGGCPRFTARGRSLNSMGTRVGDIIRAYGDKGRGHGCVPKRVPSLSAGDGRKFSEVGRHNPCTTVLALTNSTPLALLVEAVEDAGDGCVAMDCGRPTVARGMCGTHYKRWQRHGDHSVVLRSRWPMGEGWRQCDRCDQWLPELHDPYTVCSECFAKGWRR